MAEIVITEFMDQAAVDSLSDDFDVVYVPQSCDRPDELPGLLADARALIVRNRTQVRGSLLAAAPGLEVVGRLGVGLDNIDLAACRERAIEVFPATGANDLAVAEYVIAAVMILLRGAYHSFEAMLEGTWPRTALMGREITGKRLGLLGFGRIAREVAWRGTALGMEIAAFDPFVPAQDAAWQNAQRLDLDALLAQSDAVSLHVPLTDQTRHLIDRHAIANMQPGAVLVNAARGGTLDEQALADALREGHLAGAALDVFETEPLTRAAADRFKGLHNLILTPHIAGVTSESNQRVSAITADNVRRVLMQAS